MMLASTKSFGQGMWTWMAGPNTINAAPLFGTQGVSSSNNCPPALYSAYSWTDAAGNFWLYGGHDGYPYNAFGDLWKFDPTSLEWTWMTGDGSFAPQPVYGSLGISSPLNTPGGRCYSGCAWAGVDSKLWLYSGWGSGDNYGDLWRYDILNNEWAWMSGTNQVDEPPIYGTLGVADNTCFPGCRIELCNQWVDLQGRFWLYGSQSISADRSDMWMFDPSSNLWTWESGSSSVGFVDPIYGMQNVYDSANTPGSIRPFAAWIDTSGIFWVFSNEFADMWKYDPIINQWAWVNGPQTNNADYVYGEICSNDITFHPSARRESRSAWCDNNNNLWLYGGLDWPGYTDRTNDLWVFRTDSNQWAIMQDTITINGFPVYGTLGVGSAANQPGCRQGTAHWKDNQDQFWIFGGTIDNGYRSDVWRYQPDLSCLNQSISEPQANIQVFTSKVCPDSCISFGNTSTNASSFEWYFDGANPNYSTDQFPSNICYSTSGLYDVTLIVHNGPYSDTSTITNLIEVYPSPNPDISQSNDTLFANNSLIGSTYQWQFNNTNISGATNPFYVPTQNGYYSVIVTSGNGCTGYDDLQVINVGINSIITNSTFEIFPNPADESVTIVFSTNQTAQLKLYNTLGQLLQNDLVENKTTIDLKNISAGVYYITLQTENDTSTGSVQAPVRKKLIVTHR
jgi:hypothetical protein